MVVGVFFNHVPPYFWDMVSHWTWNSLFLLNWQATMFLGSIYVCTPNTEITSAFHQILRQFWGTEIRSLCLFSKHCTRWTISPLRLSFLSPYFYSLDVTTLAVFHPEISQGCWLAVQGAWGSLPKAIGSIGFRSGLLATCEGIADNTHSLSLYRAYFLQHS